MTKVGDEEEMHLNIIRARAKRINNRSNNTSFYLVSALLIGLGVAGTEAIRNIRDRQEYENARYRAAELADYFGNNDGVTDESEWKSVYRKLGIHYDLRDPVRLDVSSLRAYVREMDDEKRNSSPRPRNILPKKSFFDKT